MSLRKTMRNARKSTNYGLNYTPQEIERRIALTPVGHEDAIQLETYDGMPRNDIELTED